MSNPLEKVLLVNLSAMEPIAFDTLEKHVLRSSEERALVPLELTEQDAPGIIHKDGSIHNATMELLPICFKKLRVIRTMQTLETKEIIALNLAMALEQSVKRLYGYEKLTPLLDETGEIAGEYRQWVTNWLAGRIQTLF